MNDDKATRRGFFAKAGAVLSAPAALTLGDRDAAANTASGSLAARLAELEDAAALRCIAAAAIDAVNDGSIQVLEPPGEGLREIAVTDFYTSMNVVFGDDRLSARVSLRCIARIDAPIDAPGSALLDMARAQGEGFVQTQRPQLLELHCEKAQSDWTLASARLA